MWNPVRGQPRHAALLLNTLVGVFLTTVVAAAEVPAHGRSIAELLPRGQQTEGIFFSILPARSEDGRDAIRLPKLAETLLPSDSEAADETRFTVTTHWAASRETQSFPCVWQRSARGLSSELRLPDSAKTLNIPAKTILLLSRSRASTSRTRPEFDCSVIVPDRAADHELVLSHFGLSSGDALSGLFGIHSPWSPRGPPLRSLALRSFLARFDGIAAKQFVPTLRSGSTGIGYTFETLLDIPENNSPTGDFLGMEIKTHRGRDLDSLSTKKMNLFLKEPVWATDSRIASGFQSTATWTATVESRCTRRSPVGRTRTGSS